MLIANELSVVAFLTCWTEKKVTNGETCEVFPRKASQDEVPKACQEPLWLYTRVSPRKDRMFWYYEDLSTDWWPKFARFKSTHYHHHQCLSASSAVERWRWRHSTSKLAPVVRTESSDILTVFQRIGGTYSPCISQHITAFIISSYVSKSCCLSASSAVGWWRWWRSTRKMALLYCQGWWFMSYHILFLYQECWWKPFAIAVRQIAISIGALAANMDYTSLRAVESGEMSATRILLGLLGII